MEYSEVEIKQAKCALDMTKGSEKLVDGHDVRSAMSQYGDPYKMVTVMTDDLKLIVRSGDHCTLSLEGRKAARMGFANYLRYRKLMDELSLWGPVVSVIAAVASIIGAVVSCLG